MRSFGQSEIKRCCFSTVTLAAVAAFIVWAGVWICFWSGVEVRAQEAAGGQVAKAVGTIKSIQADSGAVLAITVTAESGPEVKATLTGTTKILRVPPGEKDLKNATALQAQDLQPGDRVLVRGQASGDGHTISALAVIVMKQADLATIRQHELDDWQKRGVGGLVTSVDAAGGVIIISANGPGMKRSIAVHVSKATILRRYAAGSVKFDDAKPAPLDQIKAGDQLLARGTRNTEGSEVSAEEIVSGTFRSIAGTIKAVDAASNSLTVQDVIAKSAVTVKLSADSQMWKLPAEMAQRFAMRLKGGGAGTGEAGSGGQGQGMGQHAGAGGGMGRAKADSSGGHGLGTNGLGGNGAGGNGPPDLQRMLTRLPNIKVADLQKGDVVYILATEGGESDGVVASKLVAGVEPILTAAPNRSAVSLLSPWTLGASAAEGEGAQ